MSLFRNIKRFFRRSITGIFTNTMLGLGLSTISVTKEKTLGISSVWRALDIYASTVAGLPLEVYERLPNGDNVKAIDNPLFYLLHDEPHKLYTSFDFRRALILNLVNPANGGNSYAFIERDRNATPTGLRILRPGVCEPIYNEQTHELYYRVQGVTYEATDIVHIKGLSENGLAGYSNAIIHKDAVGNVIATQEHAKNYYQNGATLSGVIESDLESPLMGDKGASKMLSDFEAKYGGVGNAGRVAFLQEGRTFKPVSSNAKDAGLNESRSFNVEEISRIIGVPVHLLSSLERATFNNIEHLTLQFVKFGLSALCKQIEQELNRKLLRKDQKGRLFTRFNMEGLLRGDVATRTKYYDSGMKWGYLTINEVRKMEFLNSVEGGDKNLVPLNMIDVQEAGEVKEEDKNNSVTGRKKLANAA